MTRRRTLIVELFIGPSGGKSTEAADLYATLKKRGCEVETAHEYVKRWAWEGRNISALDEFYLFGKQVHEEGSLLGKVDVVIADRPVLLSTVYADLYAPRSIRRGISEAVRAYYEASALAGHRRVAVMLPRRHTYQESGRFESEAEARKVDALIADAVGGTVWSEKSSEGRHLVTRRSQAVVADSYVGLYKYDSGAEFCDGADVAVDVSRWVAARKRPWGA